MLQQADLLKMLARAATVRTPVDVRGLFVRDRSATVRHNAVSPANGQELAGSGALVFEGEIIETPRLH